jgi:hypothetical protein
MAKVINVASLNRTSEQYDPVLRVLPFRDLRPRLSELGVRFLSSDKVLKEASFERKGGMAKPYKIGTTDPVGITALGRVKESVLTPEWGHTSLVEDIMNYEDVNVISNDPEHVDPKSKKHPQELLIMSSMVKTVGEDILDSFYFAERDDDGLTPLDLFDGIDPIVDVIIAAGGIATASGNLVATGALDAPLNSSDTLAYDRVVTFLRSANYALKRGGAVLKMNETTYFNVMSALANKISYKPEMAFQVLEMALRGDASFGNLRLSVEPEMGTGNRIYLTKEENFDFSLWTNDAATFVQVRNPYTNPNLVQFWCQWKAGARLRNYNAKMFMVNDGTNVANSLSGDYVS